MELCPRTYAYIRRRVRQISSGKYVPQRFSHVPGPEKSRGWGQKTGGWGKQPDKDMPGQGAGAGANILRGIHLKVTSQHHHHTSNFRFMEQHQDIDEYLTRNSPDFSPSGWWFTWTLQYINTPLYVCGVWCVVCGVCVWWA